MTKQLNASTGGQLLGMMEVRTAYETGRGVVRMRATAEVGPLPRGRSSITVTELPYGVGAERVIAKVKELVTGKKLQGVSDVKDLTDRQLGTLDWGLTMGQTLTLPMILGGAYLVATAKARRQRVEGFAGRESVA